jgi:16S rRNA (guanine966-N2)-methyltransferase
MPPSSRRSAPAKTPLPAAPRSAPSEVRLIGGQFKRSPIKVPDWPGLRPTPARVRETLFNWLGQDMSGWRVLDAFAGSGALGLEAASRGATQVCMIEREPTLARHIQNTATRLGAGAVRVITADALNWLRRAEPASFDLILLDPPFDGDLFDQALAAALQVVVPSGWIYLEANRAFGPEHGSPGAWPVALRIHRSGQAGAVHYHLIERVV